MATFRSNENPMFRSEFSEHIFHHKYAHENCETWSDLARTLAWDVCEDLLDNVTFTMQGEKINSLIIVSFLKQRRIPEKIGLTFLGNQNPV